MKFKKVLAMVLASALVFTGVNVSGLSGLEEVFAAVAESGVVKVEYSGPRLIGTDEDHVVYTSTLAEAIEALEEVGSKNATITLKALEKGSGYTKTGDTAVTIKGDENITLNLNGGSIGANGDATIDVKCGALTILNSEGHGAAKQIGAISVGAKGRSNVNSVGINDDGTSPLETKPVDNIGSLTVEKTRVGAITEQRGEVSVLDNTFVESVSFDNTDGEAKTSTFTMENSTLKAINDVNVDSDAGVLKSLNIKSGILGFDPTTTKVSLNGGKNTPFVSGGQLVNFSNTYVNLNLAETGSDYAVSNASANQYIGQIVGAKGTSLLANSAWTNNSQGVIEAVLGDVELTGVPGNVRIVERPGKELATSIKVSTLDKVSNVKIEETINYKYHENAKDKTATGVVDKYVTGAVASYRDGNDIKMCNASVRPIKDALECVGDRNDPVYLPTEMADAVGKPIIDQSDRHWALTLEAKEDFNDPNAKGEVVLSDARITATGLDPLTGEKIYRDIYFTADPGDKAVDTVALVKVDDSKFYFGKNIIKCAAPSASKIEVVRTGEDQNLVIGEAGQPISKEPELVLDKKYTALKTTTVFKNKQGVQETFYTYGISNKPYDAVRSVVYGAGITAKDALQDNAITLIKGNTTVDNGWNNNQSKVEAQTQTVIQAGTYGFVAKEGRTFDSIAAFTVPAEIAMAHYASTNDNLWFVGEDAIKLVAGDQEYTDALKAEAVAAGKSVGTVESLRTGAIFTDQGAYILKNVKATYNTSTKRYTGVEIFKGNETDVINDLPVYKIAEHTTEIPQVVGRDWYINKTAEYEAAKADDTQEKKASFSEAELLQEIQKAVAQATTTAVTTAINSGEVVKTEKAEQDKAAAVEAAKAEAETAKTEAVNAAKAEAETAKTEAVNAAKAEAETAKTEAVNAAKAAAATAQEAAVAAAKTQAAKEKAAAVAAAKKSASVKKGQQVVYKKNIYKVTNVSKKTLAFVGTMSTGKTISIAKTVKVNGVKYKVTEIAKKALNGNKTAKKVVIANSVKKIGKKAFAGMNKNVTFKASAKLKKLAKKAQ